MEDFRLLGKAVASRSLILALAAGVVLAILHQYIPALALVAGAVIGLAYLFHIATTFNRLVKAGKAYLPFLTVESVLRVLLAGAAPFLIVGRGPWLGYFTYLAGFVAPLAVAIIVFKNQIDADSARTSPTGGAAKTTI